MCWEHERRPRVYTRRDLQWGHWAYSEYSLNLSVNLLLITLQHVRCWWAKKWEKKVDTLLRKCHIHHFLRGAERIRSSAIGGEQSSMSFPVNSLLLLIDFRIGWWRVWCFLIRSSTLDGSCGPVLSSSWIKSISSDRSSGDHRSAITSPTTRAEMILTERQNIFFGVSIKSIEHI